MWVIFEGLDKAGKGTLEWEFLKATNYKHIVIDRGPIGYMTFDKIFNRETQSGNRNFVHQAVKINKKKDFIVIYCYASKNIIENRLARNKEICPYDYSKAQKLLTDNIKQYYNQNKVIEIDTSVMTPKDCVKLIIKKIEEATGNEL